MPYIGYFQLINLVNKFIFYDDVNYIKGGWINRNKILINNEEHLFTIPLNKASSNVLIKDTMINFDLFKRWRSDFYQTIELNYYKAPYFDLIHQILREVLEPGVDSISELAKRSVKSVSAYLSLNPVFVDTSQIYNNKHLKKESRLIDICEQEDAKVYINPMGGKELYIKDNFIKKGIDLNFLQSEISKYKQFNDTFVPGLSIIDVLMFNSVDNIRTMLDKYKLL